MNHNSGTAEFHFDESKCPISNTHRRLRQAHLLWHQAAGFYNHPELFLTNINSLIQELRNITFILQSEKHKFRDFDAWYLPLQARLKADRNCKWLHDARNLVVKQGALRGTSIATIKLLTTSEVEIAKVPIPEALSSEAILQGEDFKQRLPQIRAMASPQDDPVLMIEKSWSTSELEGRDILDVLAETYASLADIVLSAHIYLGRLNCIPLYEPSSHDAHRDFPLLYDRSGRLRCMIREAAERIDFFHLATLEQLVSRKRTQPFDVQPWQPFERYGFEKGKQPAAFAHLDPVAFAEELVYRSKKVLCKDRGHAWIVWLRDSQSTWRQITIITASRAEKHVMMRELSDLVTQAGCDAFVEVGEVWTAEAATFRGQTYPNLEKYPGRGEALAVQVATLDGLERSYVTSFTRGKNGGIKLGETEQLNLLRTNHLAPIRRAWAERRKRRRESGSLVWQPDPLECCPCGGEKPFGACCEPLIGQLRADDDVDLRNLRHNGRTEDAERIARAGVARYAIWVRQHTASSMNADRQLADLIIPFDLYALEHEINLLEESVTAAGHADSMLFTYRRLQEVLGVPALARRTVSFAARWLIRTGRIEEGLLELDNLGEIRKCNDALALTLAAQYGGYAEQEVATLLEEAVKVALEPYECSRAMELLSSHHNFDADRLRGVLQTISSLLSDPKTKEDLARRLKVLRWRILQKESEFSDTIKLMNMAAGSDEAIRYAIWLMDTNHVSETIDLLKALVEAKSPVAMLLTTDCLIRQSNAAHASEMFNSIDVSDIIDSNVAHAYAHVQGLLVLADWRDDLEKKAIQDLEALREQSSTHIEAIQTLLNALMSRRG